MARITKPFYVIYDNDKKIIELSIKTSAIFTGQKFAEFDSLSELNQFVEENQLIMPDDADIIE